MCQLHQQTFAPKLPLAQEGKVIEKVEGKRYFFWVLLLTAADFGSVLLRGAIGSKIPQSEGKASPFTSADFGTLQCHSSLLPLPSCLLVTRQIHKYTPGNS